MTYGTKYSDRQNTEKRNNKSLFHASSFGFSKTKNNLNVPQDSYPSDLDSKAAFRTEMDLRRIESRLEVLSFTKNEEEADKILQRNKDGDIICGRVNGIQVLWDRPANKLMVKDRKGLEKNIFVEEGVPFVLVECSTEEGHKYQRMIVNDYVRH